MRRDAGRLVLLVTSPRVAPGLLSGPAWALINESTTVVAGDGAQRTVAALAAAGRPVDVVAPEDVDGVLDRARAGLVVRLLDADDDAWVAALLERVTTYADPPTVEVVTGSWDLPGAHLLDLVAVMDRLRSPGGCPWDAEQTHESLVEYLVEETYEAVEAIETGNDTELREELGDLLLQVVFHARIAGEHEAPWTVDDVADGITQKLVSRHPHVFGDAVAHTPDQVEASWKALKAAEKGRESVTDGIPTALPALVLAAKMLRRAGDLDVAPVCDPVMLAADRAWEAADGEVGELLLALVSRFHDAGLDPEQELRAAVRRYRDEIRAAEGLSR